MNTLSHQKAFALKKKSKPLSARYNSHFKTKQQDMKRQKQKLQQKLLKTLSKSLRKKNLIPALDSEQSVKIREKDCSGNREEEDWLSSTNIEKVTKTNDKLTVRSFKVQSIMTSCTQNAKSCDLKKIDENMRSILSNSKIVKKINSLKAQHQKQRQIYQLVLNEKQMHRLQKIFQTEQAKLLLKVTGAKQGKE